MMGMAFAIAALLVAVLFLWVVGKVPTRIVGRPLGALALAAICVLSASSAEASVGVGVRRGVSPIRARGVRAVKAIRVRQRIRASPVRFIRAPVIQRVRFAPVVQRVYAAPVVQHVVQQVQQVVANDCYSGGAQQIVQADTAYGECSGGVQTIVAEPVVANVVRGVGRFLFGGNRGRVFVRPPIRRR
jgi:hypothetical protein